MRDLAVELGVERLGHEREVDDVAELVQHDRGAVERALAVELPDVEVDGEAALVALRVTPSVLPSSANVRMSDEPVDLRDQARRLGARPRDRLQDPLLVARRDARART